MAYITPGGFYDEDWDNSRRPVPRIRVAFGNKGLTGVTPPEGGQGRDMMFKYGRDDVPPTSAPMAGGVRLPIPVDTEAPPSGLPTGPFSRTQPPPINVRIGQSTAGMSPIDRSISVLGTQAQAAQDYPSSKVTPEGTILPPKMHHGFKDRLASIGKGLLIGLGQGGIGGAIAGGITGGISPVTIDKVMAQRALERRTQQVGMQAQIEKMRQHPGADEREVGGRIVQRQPDGTWKVTYEPSAGTAPTRRPIIEHRTNADGTTTTMRSDDNGKTWEEIPELTSKPKPDVVDIRQEEERKRNYDAANRQMEILKAQEEDARKKKEAAYLAYGNLQAQYSRQTDADARAALKPQLDDAENKAKEAQKLYEGYTEQKNKTQKDIDANLPRPVAAAPDPLVKEYADKYFKGDVDAAQKAIDAQRAAKPSLGRIR